MRLTAPGATTSRPTRLVGPAQGSTSHPPTPEQQAIIDAFTKGSNVVVEALAGTGKTTTLRMLAACNVNRSGTYLAYNKAIVREAEGRFPQAVRVGTAHSLAYQALGKRYEHRLGGKRLYARQVAEMLGVRHQAVGDATINPVMLTRLAEATVTRFCYSGDHHLDVIHLPARAERLGNLDDVGAAVLPVARKMWQDIARINGRLYFTHDHYLKLWQLSRPKIQSDYILFDEAQDANPAIAAVVQDQKHAQLVYVGDRNQQLYAWRGAVDALGQVGGERLALTKSFRFGPAIADAANEWLELLGSPHQVRGHDPIPSQVGPISGPSDAILCRTNGTALAMILAHQAAGLRVAMAPGDRTAGADIRSFAFAALDLMKGQGCNHPELAAFQTWQELCAYVEEEENSDDLKRLVNIVNRIGAPAVIDAVKALVPKERAQVTVSTAHKAKGLEWDKVTVADDFTPPAIEEGEKADPADLMLAYVTVTRAKLQLDPGSLSDPSLWQV